MTTSIYMSFARIACSLAIILICGDLNAQVKGPARHLSFDVQKGGTLSEPICNGDLIYTTEEIKGSRVGHIFNVEAGHAIASTPLKGHEVSEEYKFISLFMAGEDPAILFRNWEKKTGKVTLLVDVFDRMTFQQKGQTIEIGYIPFDPESYYGSGPDMEVHTSPDGSLLLFYFDKIKAEEVQLVMCWVTDTNLDPQWNGIYRIPAQSTGFDRSLYFDDNGSVYLDVQAVMLSEKNVKEKADGTMKVKVDHRYWKSRTRSYVKLHGEEYRVWDGLLPEQYEIFGAALEVRGDQLFFGALVGPQGGDSPVHYVLVEINDDFQPTEPRQIPIMKADREGLSFSRLILAENGRGYFLSRNGTKTIVHAFDEEDDMIWVNSMEWELWSPSAILAKKDRLHLFSMTRVSQTKKPRPGVLNQGGGQKTYPVVVTFDELGKLVIEDIITDTDLAGRNMYIKYPSFKCFEKCDCFTEVDPGKKANGLIYVPLH